MNKFEFSLFTEFGEKTDWVNDYITESSDVLIKLFNNDEINPPTGITFKFRETKNANGLSGSASLEKSELIFTSNIWQKDKFRLWIIAHEIGNLFAAHYGSPCYPSDWWANGRSPFPLFLSCLVMEQLGYKQESEWRKSTFKNEKDYQLFWDLFKKYEFKIFENFFKKIKEDNLNFGQVGKPWPYPDPIRSAYTIAYLSLSVEENLASFITQYGIGKKPSDWDKIHPNITFAEYIMTESLIDTIHDYRTQILSKNQNYHYEKYIHGQIGLKI